MNGEFIAIKHEKLTDNYLNEIILLKRQHWNYSFKSQKKWIQFCLKADDIHLLMTINNGKLVAYLSIDVVNMIVDGQEIVGKGLGNVCVSKSYQGQGFGKKIVEKANEIIKENDDMGILLCHKHLVSFYERCGWSKTQYDNVEIGNKAFTDVVMLFNNKLKHVSHMVLDRSF